MILKKGNKSPHLWFKRWSRKTNAPFLSLGKVVHIGNLPFQICDKALEKTGLKHSRVLFRLKLLFNTLLPEPEEPDISPTLRLYGNLIFIYIFLNVRSDSGFQSKEEKEREFYIQNPVNELFLYKSLMGFFVFKTFKKILFYGSDKD